MKEKKLHIGAIAYKKFDLNGDSGNRLMMLLDRLEGLSEPMSFEQLLNEIMEASRQIMKTEASSLMILDKETGELCVSLPTGPVREEIQGKRIPGDQGFGGWVVQHKIPLIANEVDDDNKLFWGELSENFTTRNLICAPMLDKEQNVIGVIQAVNRHGSTGFENEDMPVFQALAQHAARAIERNRSQEQLDNQLQEKDLLLSELHHRIKNNLALITGIVQMEEANLKDNNTRGILKNLQSRIKSINAVYDLLSNKGMFADVELGPYLKKIVESISEALSPTERGIKVQVNADEIFLHPEKALSCGLIVNEMLVNSFKHGYKYKKDGLIIVDLSKSERYITLVYKDDGLGLPEGFDPESHDSLGFQIIRALVKKLNGLLAFDHENGQQGVCSVLKFPAADD